MFDLIWVMSDHPRGVIDGPGLVVKVPLDRIYCFGDIAMLRFWRFGLKFPIHVVISAVHPQNQRQI